MVNHSCIPNIRHANLLRQVRRMETMVIIRELVRIATIMKDAVLIVIRCRALARKRGRWW